VFPDDITDLPPEREVEFARFGARNESYFDCVVSDVCIRVGRVVEAVGRVAQEAVH